MPTTEQKAEFINRMKTMCATMSAAETMSDYDLTDALGSLGGNIDSMSASIVGEVLHRWQHPIRSRWEHLVARLKSIP